MRCHILFLAAAFGLVSASPVESTAKATSTSPFCSKFDSVVSASGDRKQAAAFCTKYQASTESSKTITTTTTRVATSTVTTYTSTVTVTGSAKVVTTTRTVVVRKTSTSTTTSSATTTYTPTSTTQQLCTSPAHPVKRRATSSSVPAVFTTYKSPKQTSSACSCLGIDASTTTLTRTSTVDGTVTKTVKAKTTRTVVPTSTVTTTTTSTTSTVLTITTTTTYTSTAPAVTTTTTATPNQFYLLDSQNSQYGLLEFQNTLQFDFRESSASSATPCNLDSSNHLNCLVPGATFDYTATTSDSPNPAPVNFEGTDVPSGQVYITCSFNFAYSSSQCTLDCTNIAGGGSQNQALSPGQLSQWYLGDGTTGYYDLDLVVVDTNAV